MDKTKHSSRRRRGGIGPACQQYSHLVISLSKEERKELISRWKDNRQPGDKELLFRSNLPWIFSVIDKRYGRVLHSGNCEELVGDVLIAVYRALDYYSPERGAITTFLYMVVYRNGHADAYRWLDRYGISHSEAASTIVLKMFYYHYRALKDLDSFTKALKESGYVDDQASDAWIKSLWQLAVVYDRQPLSRQAILRNEQAFMTPDSCSTETVAEQRELREILQAGFATALTDRQRVVMEKILAGQTYKTIGETLSISKQRVDQIARDSRKALHTWIGNEYPSLVKEFGLAG